MIEQKRKEFTSSIKEFYSEQRSKIECDKAIASKFYDKVQ
jgi:hypothetical protein